jgi:hypothetical protein
LFKCESSIYLVCVCVGSGVCARVFYISSFNYFTFMFYELYVVGGCPSYVLSIYATRVPDAPLSIYMFFGPKVSPLHFIYVAMCTKKCTKT